MYVSSLLLLLCRTPTPTPTHTSLPWDPPLTLDPLPQGPPPDMTWSREGYLYLSVMVSRDGVDARPWRLLSQCILAVANFMLSPKDLSSEPRLLNRPMFSSFLKVITQHWICSGSHVLFPPFLQSDLSIKLDTRGEIFQNLNGALGMDFHFWKNCMMATVVCRFLVIEVIRACQRNLSRLVCCRWCRSEIQRKYKLLVQRQNWEKSPHHSRKRSHKGFSFLSLQRFENLKTHRPMNMENNGGCFR